MKAKLRVRMANLIVRNLAVLLMLACDRGVLWLVEQPEAPICGTIRPNAELFGALHSSAGAHLVGQFGPEMNKPSVL